MIKGFKIRIFPTPEQEILINKHIGCCRWIWNYMLDYSTTYYYDCGKSLSRFDMLKLATQIRNFDDFNWLLEVSSESVRITCTDLANAYKDFFKKVHGRPKFKSKKTS